MEKTGIDLRRLRYFVAVCEHGGFSRAAGSIGVAQPALTRQIQILEKEVGLPLVNRTGRGAEPTEEGRFLIDHARPHLDALDEAVRQLRHRSSHLSGQIVLGVCPTIAPLFLDDLLAHVRDNHPNLSVSVIEAYSGDLKNLMARGKLDLALTYHPSALRSVEAIDLLSERLVVLTAYDPDRPPSALSLAEIGRMRLIFPSAIHELRRIIDRVCLSRGVRLIPDLELDSLDAVKSILVEQASRYATILPVNSVRRDILDRRFSCFEIDDEGMRRTISVVLPRKTRNAPVSAFLVERIRRQALNLKARLELAS